MSYEALPFVKIDRFRWERGRGIKMRNLLKVSAAIALSLLIVSSSLLVLGTGPDGSISLSFSVGSSGPLQYVQAAFYYGVNSSDAAWWVNHPTMKMFIVGNWQPDASNHTFNWYVRQGRPEIKQFYYFDIYWDWLYASTMSTDPVGWNTHLLSICDESCFLHTAYPLSLANRMHYMGKSDTLLYNPNSTIFRQFLSQQIGHVLLTGRQFWPGCVDSICFNDAQTPLDGVMLDDAGASWDNAGPSAEYNLSTNWSANEAAWDQAKFELYRFLAQQFRPLGKQIVINLGGWLIYGASQIAQAMVGADGWIDEWQGGIVGTGSPAAIFKGRLDLIQSPGMQGRAFYFIDLLALKNWGSSSGVDDSRRHRVVLAEGWMLQQSGVDIYINEPDAGYGRHPVTGSSPFGPLYKGYYDAVLGSATESPQRQDLSFGSLWTRDFTNGFVALTLPNTSTSPLTSTYTVNLPGGSTYYDVQTGARISTSQIILQNGDALILAKSPPTWSLSTAGPLEVFSPLIVMLAISTITLFFRGRKTSSPRP